MLILGLRQCTDVYTKGGSADRTTQRISHWSSCDFKNKIFYEELSVLAQHKLKNRISGKILKSLCSSGKITHHKISTLVQDGYSMVQTACRFCRFTKRITLSSSGRQL